MDQKTAYRQLCQSAEDLPLFSQPWYLDAVCEGGRWDVILVEKGNRIAASLPYFLKRKGPFRYATMPQLTKFLGPYVIPAFRKSKHEARLIRELIRQVPKLAFFRQNLHYDYTNWLPFYWEGFQQQTYYSYRISPLSPLENTFAHIRADYRNHKIARIDDQMELRTDRSIDDLYQINRKSYQRQGLAAPFSLSFLKRLHQAASEHRAGGCFFAVDQEQNIHSAAYLLWDRRAAYLLMIGDDPELRSSGAGIWLVWQLIQHTAKELQLDTFDFLGSMIESIERVRRQFGAQQIPYSAVWKYGSRWIAALHQFRG